MLPLKKIITVGSACLIVWSTMAILVSIIAPAPSALAAGDDKATKDKKTTCVPDKKSGVMVCALDNPLASDTTDVRIIAGQVIKGVLGLVGAITLAMFVYGGFTWLISAGTPEKIKSGRDTMIWAALGLVAVFAAYSFLSYLLKYIA